MERRALIAVVISIAILVLYQEFVMKRLYGPTSQQGSAEPAAAPTPASTLSTHGPSAEAAPPAAAPAQPDQGSVPVIGTDVVVDTDLYRAVFTTAGARLKSFVLKNYRATVAPGSPPLELVQYPLLSDLPLGVVLRGAQAQSLSDAEVLYRADQSELNITGDATATVTFTGQLNGSTVRKTLSFSGNRYDPTLDVAVDNPPSGYTEMAVSWVEGMNPAGPKAAEVVFDQVLALQDGKLHHIPFTSLDAGQLLEQNITWIAFSGHYFVAAVAPDADDHNELRAWAKRTDQSVQAQLIFPPGTFHARSTLFVGPKIIDLLEAAHHSLRRAVDLGWFTFVALPMLQALRFLHRFTGNYGVAIIVLTVLIKLLFFPLTKKSFESMRAMQKLQPEMAKIRERLQDKPDEMNREIMELYKRHKVNPLGGCLPMVLQLPVFIGLYSALQNAIELRHAPFIGWIHDLSAPDRLGTLQLPFVDQPGIPVLTLLMGVSMFVQQWMTPSAADPAQQRVMMIMPLMFTFMFINFPAGLTVYWLANNLLTIGQQYAMSRPTKR